MAKMEFNAEIGDIYSFLDQVVEDMGEANVAGLKAQQEVIQNAVRENYIKAGGSIGDYIYDSIGQSQELGDNGQDAVGTVGVYRVDNVMVSHGRTPGKDITAAQIAYWLEYGTSRLKSSVGGGRKKKNIDYPESYLNFNSPKAFVSESFYRTLSEQQKAFADAFMDHIER